MYRLQFKDKHIEPSGDREKMKAEIRRCFPGREDAYDVFHKREKERFEKLFPCLQKPYHNLTMLLHPDLLKAVPHLAMGRSLFNVMYGYFKDEELALVFTFQSKYLGMSPWECPGLYAMIPYIEHGLGVYHVMGGLSMISEKMAEVARGTSIPVATGERLTTKWEFARIIEHRAASILQPDLGRSGGILETKKIAAMAEAFHIQVAPHCYCGPIVAAANIQMAATLPNFLILEAIKTFDGFHETLLKKKIEWQDGHVIPSREPGLGVELNEDVCEAHPWTGSQLHLSMVPAPVGG